jgi:hypothetical protein
MKDDLDRYVEKRWGSWDKMYAATEDHVGELVEEIWHLNLELKDRMMEWNTLIRNSKEG